MDLTVCYLQQGVTALHVASIHDRSDMVELLLKRGADINIKDKVVLKLNSTYIYYLTIKYPLF